MKHQQAGTFPSRPSYRGKGPGSGVKENLETGGTLTLGGSGKGGRKWKVVVWIMKSLRPHWR